MTENPPGIQIAAEKRFQANHIRRLAAVIRAEAVTPGPKEWRKQIGTLTPEQVALLILTCVIRSRLTDDDEPPSRQSVAMCLAESLGMQDPGPGETREKMLRTGVGLLEMAVRAELIEDIQRPRYAGNSTFPVRLTAAAERCLPEYLTGVPVMDDEPSPTPASGPVFVRRRHDMLLRPEPVSEIYADAIGVLRKTPWRVNQFVLAVMEGVDRDEELLRIFAGESPAKPTERSKALEIARRLQDKIFYFDAHCDFRGRVYQRGALRFTGASGSIQALLEFAQGERVIDNARTRGALHLAAHVAAKWGQKGSVEQIANWTIEHETLVLGVATDPLKHREWTTEIEDEDDRWLALAACDAWRRFKDGEPVHLPCSFDATTSGLQVYAMLMRDAELGAKVGLLGGARGRFYEEVAEECCVTRAEAKAVGVPFSYGGVSATTLQALAEGRGIEQKKTKDQRSFRFNKRQRGALNDELKETNTRLRATIEKHAPAFVAVREWLSGEVAPVFNALKSPIGWRTPLGFVVTMDYREMVEDKVATWIKGKNAKDGKSERIVLFMLDPSDELNCDKQASSMAANVVHSLDANLLIATVLYGAVQIGDNEDPPITQWGVVHDCFAVHPNYAHRLRVTAAKSAIWWVFSVDWLADLHAQLEEQAGVTIPPPPMHEAKLAGDFLQNWEALTV